ncbi:MAG: hypothetical protein BSOLF_2627 [Candidatus Carbobacillus altaicus]|uniref:DUF4870 domain-containing protein n=1 Tax=Candidatus Carbonibacillus altaicus TaxID=2163959 RepID=A0A2R6Y2F5_9BACL|nr:MAG: hypothetical protein BSOLF_2627 [Candidatus Carbobacillus altaicus]
MGKPMSSQEERLWSVFAHLSHLVNFILPFIPFVNVIAPLALWLWRKNDSDFFNDQGKEALNFQITVSIVIFILQLLTFLTTGSFGLNMFRNDDVYFYNYNYAYGFYGFMSVWVVLLSIVKLLNLILTIIAAVQAHNGVRYRYPLNLRLVK